MKVLVTGVGRLGAQVASVLAATHNEITIVDQDQDEDRLAEIAHRLGTRARALPGDACEPSVLEAAGALNTDLLVAATGDDEDNLVISMLAKRQCAVPRVVARVNDPDNAWLFDDQWGVDVALPATMPLISLVEEATGAADTVALGRLTRAGVNVIETAIADTSRACGRRLAELPLPPGSIVAAVIRRGRPSVPDQNFQLEPGDELLVVSEDATKQDIHKAFQ